MAVEDDKLDKIVDMLDAGHELTDDELALLVQDAEAMSAAQDAFRIKRAVAACTADADNGIKPPFDIDAEWASVAPRLEADTPAPRRLRLAIYTIVGIAAMLLLMFGITTFLSRDADTQRYAYTRIADAPSDIVMTSSANNKAVVVRGDSQNISSSHVSKADRNKVLKALGYETDDVPTDRYTISIPPGKSYSIVLADGTQVWMYAGSRLTYPSRFIGDERNVYLQGEAYFKVAKDAAHPFVITTDRAEARVLGTELNVSCYDASSCHIALINGSVEVKGKSSDSFVRLVPGQGATISSTDNIAVAAEDMEGYEYWRNGFIYFDDAPLSDIATAIGRWYNVNVEFTDKTLQDVKLRFFCRRDESLRRAIDLLNGFESFSATFEGETLNIGRK